MTGRPLVLLREGLLTLAAIGGVICIVLVLAAQLFHVSIIMFTTGSMTPTIPAGSAALVREIPATQIRVGDVLTVDRPGALPITHRVVGVAPGPDPAQRSITMRGDANDADDPEPYLIDRGRIVLGSVPGLAHVIVWFGHPAVLAAITLSAATLVTWSFWPRRERPARRVVSAPGPARRATNRARHAAAPGRVGALGLALFLGLGLALSPGSRPALASAAEPEAGGAIRISSVASPRIAQLSPGDSGDWDLTVDTSRAPAGTLTVSLQASGDAGLGLTLAVRACAERWTATGCGRGERTVAERRVADLSGAERRVTDARTRGTLWLRVTGSVPEDARPEPGERVQLTAVVRAGEETVRHDLPADGWPAGGLPVPGVSGLANTGQVTDAWRLAVAAVLGGLLLAALARRRRAAGPGAGESC